MENNQLLPIWLIVLANNIFFFLVYTAIGTTTNCNTQVVPLCNDECWPAQGKWINNECYCAIEGGWQQAPKE